MTVSMDASSREDEQALLDLLNTTPAVGGRVQDALAGDREARAWALDRGGSGSTEEARGLRHARDALQAVVRGAAPAGDLAAMIGDARLRPNVTGDGVRWTLDVDEDGRLAARMVLAWGGLREHLPGRLRPCANDECRLFVLDRSRANTARWCSMKVCGNRMKARRHYRRHRAEA